MLEASLHLAAGGAAPHDAPVLVSALADGAGALPLDPLEVFVRRSGPVVGRLVEAFSFLAVGTSFIGTALSLSGACVPARPSRRATAPAGGLGARGAEKLQPWGLPAR